MRIKNAVAMAISIVLVVACGTPQTQVGRSAKTGAGVGALAGLVFGGDLEDVIAGAAIAAITIYIVRKKS